MMKISKKLVLQGITGGTSGLALLILLISIVAFNSEDYYHDDKLGMQFGMKIELTEGQIFVWMHAPRALYIKTTVLSVAKIEDDGSLRPGGLVDLFPVTETTHGAIELSFEIYAADEEVMPDLANRTQSLSPIVNILKESQLPTLIRYIALVGVTLIYYWTLFGMIYLALAFLLIIVGIAWIYKNKLDSNRVMVILEKLKESPD